MIQITSFKIDENYHMGKQNNNNYFPNAEQCTQNYQIPFLQMMANEDDLPPVFCVLKCIAPQEVMEHPFGY